MNHKLKLTKADLEGLYPTHTQAEIAKMFGVSQTCVGKNLRRYGIIATRNQLDDLTGKTFGSLTILYRLPNTKNNRVQWQCKCKCGREKSVTSGDIKSGDSKSCGKCHWHCFIQDSYWTEITRNAKQRGKEFSITKDYMTSLWNKQEGKCAISGLPLNMPVDARKQRGPECTASIDRIDNTIGYVEGNVQWVYKDVNRMRREYTIERYIEICKAVASNNEV